MEYKELKPCKCGKLPKIVERYDTLQVVCECGEEGEFFFGDYYDEAFMMEEYGEQAIDDWNEKVGDYMVTCCKDCTNRHFSVTAPAKYTYRNGRKGMRR